MKNEGIDNDAKTQDRIAYWLGLAQYDLDTAETLLKGDRFLYVGFMCHQSIEKTLKACFVKHCSRVPPFTHNLGFLARESGIDALLGEDQRNFLDSLEPLNIESRYPDHKRKVLDGLTFAKCESILGKTKDLQEWLRQQL